jgi:hypothetical protein
LRQGAHLFRPVALFIRRVRMAQHQNCPFWLQRCL